MCVARREIREYGHADVNILNSGDYYAYCLFVGLGETMRGARGGKTFAVDISGARPNWVMEDFIQKETASTPSSSTTISIRTINEVDGIARCT
ncbi:GMP synthase domain-containing protein [Colletotrichum orchidophilum]|uniref:GMP synthase domain-containing protein n=1 Tax=Colletotrichum orchidophilum TaxID=1209926 RepID=A0A1G4AZM2_9PEZI|nr:GMP synthase domain-containing protein [Colletotrichum orchidophilum]OHE94482.1 GMP synthase domain-containing protein [Colletotrichum orchidophilum]